jgi:hypothetical protein
LTRKSNPNSPWRRKHGGLGPLSEKQITKYIASAMERDNSRSMSGVPDVENVEAPDRLTWDELKELL